MYTIKAIFSDNKNIIPDDTHNDTEKWGDNMGLHILCENEDSSLESKENTKTLIFHINRGCVCSESIGFLVTREKVVSDIDIYDENETLKNLKALIGQKIVSLKYDPNRENAYTKRGYSVNLFNFACASLVTVNSDNISSEYYIDFFNIHNGYYFHDVYFSLLEETMNLCL